MQCGNAGHKQAECPNASGSQGAGNALAASLSNLNITVPALSPAELKAKDQKRKEKAEERKRNLARWAEAELKFPAFQAGLGAPLGNTTIRSNFFKLTLNGNVRIHKYRIELDNVNDREPANRYLTRYLIGELLKANPPTSNCWTSNWFSHIVSVGKLYNSYNDDKMRAHPVPHSRTPPRGQTVPQLQSKIFFEGTVEVAELARLVQRNQSPMNKDYHPGQDLMALNIIFWKDVIQDSWPGTRIGKKFYPNTNALSKDVRRAIRVAQGQPQPPGHLVYKARSGFFCSTRPGDGSLLLSINTTTSAFFPTLILQNWIANRFGDNVKIPPVEGREELEGLKVTFEGDTPQPKREFKIIAVSASNVSDQRYDNTSTTSVYDVITASKLAHTGIIELIPLLTHCSQNMERPLGICQKQPLPRPLVV